MRAYEVKVHDLELENNTLTGTNKELDMFRDENSRKLMALNEKLEERDEEIKKIRNKGTDEVLKFRKKESKTIELEAALKSRS